MHKYLRRWIRWSRVAEIQSERAAARKKNRRGGGGRVARRGLRG